MSDLKENVSCEQIDILENAKINEKEADSFPTGVDRQLKVAANGHTILTPQPSDDPDDPLNWPSIQKHIVLATVVACSFLPDYGSVTGAVTLTPQAQYVDGLQISSVPSPRTLPNMTLDQLTIISPMLAENTGFLQMR